MTTPTYCSDCGHELGIGRFCTNCGRPVPGRHPEATPTADAPPQAPPRAAPPVTPPQANHVPTSARFPLYADAPPTVLTPPTAHQALPGIPPTPYPPAPGTDRSPRWVPWAVAIVLLGLVAGLGTFLLVSGGDDDQRGEDARSEQSQTRDATAPTGPKTPDSSAEPDSSGSGEPVDEPDPGEVVDLTSQATAQVPAIAPPSRDRQNNPVGYGAENMWDGKPRTTWRMPGDGTGSTITFDLGTDVVLTRIGLINGYAKVDGPDNWYASNRRIRAVQWEFDDGTRVTQDFADKQSLQMATVGPIRTRTVRIQLLTVTAPGKGTSGRDFTAISEVQFLGAPED